MPALPVISGRAVVRAFETCGWSIARRSSSHIILIYPEHPVTLSIPDHREVARGTLRSLIRSAGLHRSRVPHGLSELNIMQRMLPIATLATLLAGLALGLVVRGIPQARGQRPEAPRWEYRVGWFSYNPGESLNDEQRRLVFEKELNARAAEGWEPAGVILDRNVVQSVGGSVVTRDSVSFVAFRRPRR